MTSLADRQRVGEALARANVAWANAGIDGALVADLAEAISSINEKLWEQEDEIRDCERRADFGEIFVVCARTIVQLNDQRSALKREISERFGMPSADEVKIYAR